MDYSDSSSTLRRYNAWCDNNNRSFNATQSNFRISQGVVESLVGMESPSHIGMVYDIRLIDTGVLIRCRRLVNSASFDGVGEYNPLEEGDPVVVAFKEGQVQDGIILGSFYTEGTYKEFYVEGQGLKPKETKKGPVRPIEFNQPSIHPNRVAQPDAWFHIVGGKTGPYRDPALTDGSRNMRANKRPFPASIQIKNKLGDVGQYAKGDIIFYSDSNIILFSSQEGKSKCKRIKEMALYYQQMVEEMEAFLGVQIDTNTEPKVLQDKADKPRSLVNGGVMSGVLNMESNSPSTKKNTTFNKSLPNTQTTSSQPTEEKTYDYTDDDRRNRSDIDGRRPIDFMMYAPLVEYHLPQLKAMAAKCKELSITCKEDEINDSNSLNSQLSASQISQDVCSALSPGGQLNDEKIEALAEGRICVNGKTRHYPFNKWKLDKSQSIEIGDLASAKDREDIIIHKATLEAFKKMRDAALKESGGSIDLAIASGYRDKEYLAKNGLENRDCGALGGEFLPKPEQSTSTNIPINTNGKKGLVVIDPGHGAPDPGAVGNGIQEASYVLEIGKALVSALNAVGIKTLMTRDKDAQVASLSGAVALATDNKANLFVSIHCNASMSSGGNGVEVYRYHPISDKLAGNVLASITTHIPQLHNRGVKTGNFTVISATSSIPSIFIELGFISSPKDAALMKQTDTKAKYVKAIAEGIIKSL